MKKLAGFTLIELLIYLALFGIMLGGVCSAVYAMLEFSGSNQSKMALQEEGNFLLGKFDWAMTGAASITIYASPPSLMITKYNFFGNPLLFKIEGSDLKLKKGNEPDNILNNSQIQIADLIFQNIPEQSETVNGVRIGFTLKTKTPHGNILSQDFQADYYLYK